MAVATIDVAVGAVVVVTATTVAATVVAPMVVVATVVVATLDVVGPCVGSVGTILSNDSNAFHAAFEVWRLDGSVAILTVVWGK